MASFGKSHSRASALIYSACSKGLLDALGRGWGGGVGGSRSLALCEAREALPVSVEMEASDSSSMLTSARCRQATFSAFLGAAVGDQRETDYVIECFCSKGVITTW